MLSILDPYSIESSNSNIISGVFLKFTFLASSERTNPADFFNPANVSLIFLEFNILTYTFAYFKSFVTFTFVTLINPVTLGFFNS